jgi:hypothetical protein
MAYETAIVGGMIGVMFLWAYIAFNIRSSNETDEGNFEPLRILLILMVFLSIGLTLFMMGLIADTNLASVGRMMDTAFKAYGTVFTFVIGYYILMLVIFGIKTASQKRTDTR